MPRINIETGKLIEREEFTGPNPEKQLQQYIEKYLNLFLQSHYLKNFYKIPGGEIDTLAITEEGNPCIIEFKRKQDDKIINQIIYYYDWLQNRPTKYEFERIVKENPKTKNMEVNWSRIRLITIAKDYSKWDISLIKHLNTDIECYTYTYHKDELDIHLDPIINQYKKPISYSTISNQKTYTLDDHRNKVDNKFKQYFDDLRREILNLGEDIDEGYVTDYIKYVVRTTFAAIYVRKQRLIIDLRVDEENFDDPKKLTKDISHPGLSVNRELRADENIDISDAISIIKQAYEYQQ